MGTMGTSNNTFVLPHTLTDENKNKSITFLTEGKFIEHSIRVDLTTPTATQSTSLNNNTNSLTWGTVTSGQYSPTATISGSTTTSSSGWVSAGSEAISQSIVVGKVNQSTLKNGTTAINSGATVNPTNSSQTINISEGYNAARTVVFGPISAGPKGAVTSGSATIDTLSYTYISDNGNFRITGSADVSAPTVNTAGYISLLGDGRHLVVGLSKGLILLCARFILITRSICRTPCTFP